MPRPAQIARQPLSGRRGSGSTGRTVNRRMAFTPSTVAADAPLFRLFRPSPAKFGREAATFPARATTRGRSLPPMPWRPRAYPGRFAARIRSPAQTRGARAARPSPDAGRGARGGRAGRHRSGGHLGSRRDGRRSRGDGGQGRDGQGGRGRPAGEARPGPGQRPLRQRQPGQLALARPPTRPMSPSTSTAAPPRSTRHPITGSTNYLDKGAAAQADVHGARGRERHGAGRLVRRPPAPLAATWMSRSRPRPAGSGYTYEANDASVGDLDGDGDLDLVLKWQPTNAKDNSQSGVTGNTIVDGVHRSTASGCGASTWAATSAPARTTPSSRCTTTTATARPRSR